MQPDIVPSPEGGVHVGVMAGKSARQASASVRRSDLCDARDGQLLDEDVGCFQYQTAHWPLGGAGKDDGDRSTVAVSDQDRLVDFQSSEQVGKDSQRFNVHIIYAARRLENIRPSVAAP